MRRENLVHPARVELQVPAVPLVTEVRLALLDLLDSLDLLVQMASLD